MRLLVARLLGLAHTLTLSALPNSPRSRSETPRARCSGTLELRSEMQASRDVMAWPWRPFDHKRLGILIPVKP